MRRARRYSAQFLIVFLIASAPLVSCSSGTGTSGGLLPVLTAKPVSPAENVARGANAPLRAQSGTQICYSYWVSPGAEPGGTIGWVTSICPTPVQFEGSGTPIQVLPISQPGNGACWPGQWTPCQPNPNCPIWVKDHGPPCKLAPLPGPIPCYGPSYTSNNYYDGVTGSNSIVANFIGNSPLQNLAINLANAGWTGPLYEDTLPQDPNGDGQSAAQAHVDYNVISNDYIVWDNAAVAQAVANGQNAAQILFHEYDHIYNSLADPAGGHNHRIPQHGDQGFPANGTATVSVGGQNLSFNVASQPGWTAYSHAVIHNDLVAAYGEDQTGALYEAAVGATNALSPWPSGTAIAFARQNARLSAALSMAPNNYKYPGSCAQGVNRHFLVRPLTDPTGGNSSFSPASEEISASFKP